MSTHTIKLDDIRDHLTIVSDDEGAEWPEPYIEVTVRWHAPEPDVGIFSAQAEIMQVSYYLDSNPPVRTDDQDAFCLALHKWIGDWIAEGPADLAELLDNRIENEEFEP